MAFLKCRFKKMDMVMGKIENTKITLRNSWDCDLLIIDTISHFISSEYNFNQALKSL